MAFYRSKLFWGVAALVGLVLAAYGVIRLIPGKYFEQGDRYVTYFDESVQGLQEDSRVRYRGVDVGVVMGIRLAPDQKLIEVPLKLRLKKEVAKEVVAQLKVNPISGQVYLELDRLRPDEKVRTFKLAFTPKYPVIPSRFADIQKALSGLNILVEKFEEADAKGIFDQVRSTVKQVEVFFRGPRMESILEKVEGTMGNLQSSTGSFDKILASGRVEEVLTEARDTLKETHTTLTKAQGVMTRMDEAVGRTGSLAAEIKATNDNLRHATETLDTLVNRINERPSDLLFGKPSPGRFNE
ncbi:MAG: MCE family protein [Deltaproteobacteria bacterium]|nr:MCE family protein [Deltaproteobacteria bacterium]MBI4794651.1 MCE family protein [Deltaproteobacteria bacterium]